MFFRQIFDEKLAQYAYLIGCQATGEALVIDPERDVDRYARAAEAEGLTLTAAAETHIHADFLSGARELAERHGAKIYLSDEGTAEWTYQWTDGYDVRLLKDGDAFTVGRIEVRAVHTPGHTPEHLSFLITDRGGGADAPMGLATGDFVFVGNLGRPDLLESATGQKGAMKEGAAALYNSAQHFLKLEDYVQVWPGHGAGSACGKALGSVPETTVGYERRFSPALGAAQRGKDAFVGYILEDQPEPPLYFARMKQLNRDGVPLLDRQPDPAPLSVEELGRLADSEEAVVLDARADRAAFMQGHLPGALYAPWGKSFPTIAGSYVEPDSSIYLLIEEEHVEEAVLNLIRIGLDDVAGYATPQTLAGYAAQGGALASTEQIDTEEMERRRTEEDIQVVDVRSGSEYRAGHVPGALLAPHTRLPERTGDVPTGKTLLVHCGSGARASSAVSLLQRRGFEVVHVDDRIARWLEAHPAEAEKDEPATT